jgi:hypothetical protein
VRPATRHTGRDRRVADGPVAPGRVTLARVALPRRRGVSARGAIAAVLVVGGLLALAGCAAPSPTPSPSPTLAPATPEPPATTPASSPASPPVVQPSPTAAQPSPPAGTVAVDIPEAGVLIPVPAGWVQVPAADLADPATRAELAARYPGSDALLAQADRLEGRATPVLLAVDPGAAARSDPLAANLSALVTQPSISGPLLDFVAGLIADGMAESLGATGAATTERVQLAAGEAVRIGLPLPPRDGHEMSATAWIIGAPGGTMLVTLMGPATALGGLDPDALAAAIVPDAGAAP